MHATKGNESDVRATWVKRGGICLSVWARDEINNGMNSNIASMIDFGTRFIRLLFFSTRSKSFLLGGGSTGGPLRGLQGPVSNFSVP